MVVLKPHRPERLRLDLVQPVRVGTRRRSQVDMKRRPVVFIPHRNRRRARVDVQQFVGNRILAQWRQIRAVRPHHVEAVFREKHDRIVHPAPSLRSDDPDRFGDPLKLTGRRVSLNRPQRSGARTDQDLILVGNHRRRQRTDVGRQRQLKRQCPALVGDVLPVIPVGVRPLPAHVDRVVLPGDAEPVPVDRSERAGGWNRAFRRRQRGHGPRLRIQPGDSRRRDGVNVLLAGDEEPRGRCRRGIGHRAGFDGLDERIRQHAQNRTGPGRAGDVDRSEVNDRRPQLRADVLRESLPAAAPETPVEVVFQPRVHAPRGVIPLPPFPGRAHRQPAIHTGCGKLEVFRRHGIALTPHVC